VSWRPRNGVLVASVVCAGVLLRASFLAREPLWADEAESAINSLTLLDRGYPADRYLGMPIYENTLLRQWPESEEYEFKDVSYSRRGFAIYHGWLPLYSIAGALSLAGITPDRPATAPHASHSSAEFVRRTVAPRLPALAFSALFLLALYALGTELQGRELGWGVLVAAAFCEPIVWFGWQARYYAATLALSAATALWTLKLRKGGGLGTAAVLGVLLVLLFHSHSMSFLIAAAVLAWSVCGARPLRRLVPRLAVVGATVAVGTIPWMLATGFLEEASEIPKAWTLLVLPQDLVIYPLKFPAISLVIGLGLLAFVLVLANHRRLPARLVEPFAEARATFTFAGPWLFIAFITFSLLIPAASHFGRRISLVVVTPGLLLTVISLSVVLRVLRQTSSTALTVLATLGVFVVMGKLPFTDPPHTAGFEIEDLVATMSRWRLRPATKLYVTPNDHLVLTYYTGLPFQNVAAVRRSFLDAYPGDVVILETGPYLPLRLDEIQALAASVGTPVDDTAASQRSKRAIAAAVHRVVATQVRDVKPPLPALDRLDELLVHQVVDTTRERVGREWRDQPMLRGYEHVTTSFWSAFFYRFANVESRLGPDRNYAGRISRGRAIVLPGGAILYDCRTEGGPPLLSDAVPLDP
jgi:hypothetical protein